MSTRTVHLTDHLDRFIEDGITSGRFTDANEAVSQGLGLLEMHQHDDEAKLEWLRAAAKDAFDQLDRGEGIQFASIDELAAHIDQMGNELEAEGASERRLA